MFEVIRGSRSFVAGVALAVLCAGCASGGGGNFVPSQVVQTFQVGDDALDCDSLTSEIAKTDAAIDTLTRKINTSKTMSWVTDMAKMINRSAGQDNLMNSILSSRLSGSIEDEREVRDSLQQRRDVLIQQHLHKQCAHGA